MFSYDIWETFESDYFEGIAEKTKSNSKRSLDQLYRKRYSYTGTLAQVLSWKFCKENYEHNF